MNASPREFFQHTLLHGALAGLFTARPSLAESVITALQQADEGAPPQGEHDSKSFLELLCAGDAGVFGHRRSRPWLSQ